MWFLPCHRTTAERAEFSLCLGVVDLHPGRVSKISRERRELCRLCAIVSVLWRQLEIHGNG
jgi:hypothetical protein